MKREPSAYSYVKNLVPGEAVTIPKDKLYAVRCAIAYIADKLGELGEGYNNETIFVVHGGCAEEAQQLADICRSKYGVKHVNIGYLGPVIGAHTGPGVLAVFFLGKHR